MTGARLLSPGGFFALFASCAAAAATLHPAAAVVGSPQVAPLARGAAAVVVLFLTLSALLSLLAPGKGKSKGGKAAEREVVKCRFVVNAAGLYSDKVRTLAARWPHAFTRSEDTGRRPPPPLPCPSN